MLFFSHLLPLLLLLQLISSSFLISSADNYSLPTKYFINCGSKSDAEYGGHRRFVGDINPSPLTIDPGKSKVVKNSVTAGTIPESINEIYQTARVYNRPSWYVFGGITQNGTYVVRLHFFPLSLQNLVEARFNVSASCGFQLLSNFSLQNVDGFDKTLPVVKEFAFELKEGPLFGIQFSPLESSLAFVNAIEVFLAPQSFKPETAFAISPEARIKGNTKYPLASHAFQTAYRVSMGGSLITPDEDALWRTWLPDDKFMARPSPAINITYGGNVYKKATTLYIAPPDVYSTAKAIDMNTTKTSTIKDPKITWVFKVKKRSKYFLRIHFCDIIEQNTPFLFDYFLGINRTDLDPIKEPELNKFASPFWYEYIVVTDGSGYYNVGIAHNKDAPFSRAFLNGFEMMELIDKSFPDDVVDLKLKQGEQSQKFVVIGVCVGGAVIVALVIGLGLFCYVRNRKSKKRRHWPSLVPDQNDPSSEKIMSIADLAPDLNLELKITFAEITAATNNFDEKKLIGVGGFGMVYVGTIRGKEVAVKRSRPGHGQGIKEFRTEIIILSQIRHRHLVSLYGYCDENQEMILVYEYMSGGTLTEYLYGSKTRNHLPLSWKQRVEICIDAAKGLDYLHTGSAAGVIIHRDIKTTNILLDKDSSAKVADFGISKTGIPDPNEFDTTIKGTYGYLDPEYFNTGQLTEKSDVYAFGVVLFEVLAARPPIVRSLPNEEVNLAEWAVVCKRKGKIEKIIDPFLVGSIEANSLRKFVELAEKCVDDVGANRPSMHDVVYDLDLVLQFQLTPIGGGKGFEGSTTMADYAPWEIGSGILDRIPSRGLDDSIMIDEDSTTVNARALVTEFKIVSAR